MLSSRCWAITGTTALLLTGMLAQLHAQQGIPLCESHPPYFLVMLPHAYGDTTGNLLVKSGNDRHACVYKSDPGDYELQRVNFNRFAKVVDSYLFLGGGSAPIIGELSIYDLKRRTKVFEHTYMGKNIRVEGRTILFTEHLGTAKREQCKDYDKIQKQNLTPTLEADVAMNMDDLAHPEKLKLQVRSKTRCVATQ